MEHHNKKTEINHSAHVDKKSEAGDIRFVLIDGPGRALVRTAPDSLVREVIDACCI